MLKKPVDPRTIIDLFLQGMKQVDIGKKLGITHSSVSYWIVKHGTKRRCRCGKPAKVKWCSRHCQNVYGSMVYREKNKEACLTYAKTHSKTPEGRKAQQKFRDANRQRLNAYAKVYQSTHKEEKKAYRQRTKNKTREHMKAYRKANRERDREYRRKYWEKLTPEQKRAYRRRGAEGHKKKKALTDLLQIQERLKEHDTTDPIE